MDWNVLFAFLEVGVTFSRVPCLTYWNQTTRNSVENAFKPPLLAMRMEVNLGNVHWLFQVFIISSGVKRYSARLVTTSNGWLLCSYALHGFFQQGVCIKILQMPRIYGIEKQTETFEVVWWHHIDLWLISSLKMYRHPILIQ